MHRPGRFELFSVQVSEIQNVSFAACVTTCFACTLPLFSVFLCNIEDTLSTRVRCLPDASAPRGRDAASWEVMCWPHRVRPAGEPRSGCPKNPHDELNIERLSMITVRLCFVNHQQRVLKILKRVLTCS